MFIVEAIADFSPAVMRPEEESEKVEQVQKEDEGHHHKQEQIAYHVENHEQQKSEIGASLSNDEISGQKRKRTKQQQEKLAQQAKDEKEKEQGDEQQIKYTEFKSGEKILVKETFENGWWLGHPIKKPELEGFFPSNYVKTGVQPPPPPSPAAGTKNEKAQQIEYDPEAREKDWMKQQLQQIKAGPVTSDYYQGITGFKLVKINQKNQNILKGNHVQFDVATGLAKVPVKDQAPTAKAIRQMGYYFDYHQWNQAKNQNPQAKSRPDPKKKKPKKLRLKMMDP